MAKAGAKHEVEKPKVVEANVLQSLQEDIAREKLEKKK
jgi:hypothetical protein